MFMPTPVPLTLRNSEVSFVYICTTSKLFTNSLSCDLILCNKKDILLPTPGEAKAKAMPGRLYTHT